MRADKAPIVVFLSMYYDSLLRALLFFKNLSLLAGNQKLVKRAAGDPFSRRSAVDKNFIRFGRSMDYFHEKPKEKNLMSFARVSRAAKDNFMRFGRNDEELFSTPTAESTVSGTGGRGDNFMRFGRKDNFMRFGRKDNFMRFGRKDNFMRFGRDYLRPSRKDNFMRFGRPDNFMRFGRKDNFMRFGRDPSRNAELKDDSYKKSKSSFVRFGKSPKNEDGFIRFGRSEPEEDELKIDDDGPEVDPGDLDLQADKPKNGPIIRIKRDALTSLWEVEANSANRSARDTEIMEEIPPLTAQPEKNVQKRFVAEFVPESQLDDLEPVEIYPEFYIEEDKRNTGGSSNFIRFG